MLPVERVAASTTVLTFPSGAAFSVVVTVANANVTTSAPYGSGGFVAEGTTYVVPSARNVFVGQVLGAVSGR